MGAEPLSRADRISAWLVSTREQSEIKSSQSGRKLVQHLRHRTGIGTEKNTAIWFW
jgi:hypothetical protein